MASEIKCKTTVTGSKHRRLCIDCTRCPHIGGFDSPICQRKILPLLKRNKIDEVKFIRKDFSELYRVAETSIYNQLLEKIKNLEDSRIWNEIHFDDRNLEEVYKNFVQDLLAEFSADPVKAYGMLCGVINQYRHNLEEEKQIPVEGAGNIPGYVALLEKILAYIQETSFAKYYRSRQLKEHLRPLVQPTFIGSNIDLTIPVDGRLVDLYRVAGAEVKIYEHEGERLYFLNPPEIWLHIDHVNMLSRLNEYISKQHSLDVFNPKEAREYFRRLGSENLPKISSELPKTELDQLCEIFSRYSAGYGLLEIMFRDPNITDIYVDSPPGATPVYINHAVYGSCLTNLYLVEEDLERLSSKFRAISERPFDEANPILDMDLQDVGIRVAGIREPSTFEGLAYAFRKRRENPWTIARFVQKGMLSAKSAAILSFLISGHCAMLITGARGAGKTSLLSALIAEVDQRDRIILMEDTAEIPSYMLREAGWRIEHMKNQSVISHKKGYELAPEENLRAALRLGESVLVLGEVRGSEAKVLFEAMRVGAAGNSVLGTIHGSSPYDTWDRITHDLGVPKTSFKAVDVIVCLRYREVGFDAGKMRRVMQITEVRKKWDDNPEKEGAFHDIMKFNEYSDVEEYGLSDSEIIREICMRKGMSFSEFDKLLSARERMFNVVVKYSRRFDDLLELKPMTEINKKFRLLYYQKGVDRFFPEWESWFRDYLVKRYGGRVVEGFSGVV